MAYRRTYWELEAPYSDELDFDLEFTDGEIFQAVEAILNQEERAYEMRRKLRSLGASLSGQDKKTWKEIEKFAIGKTDVMGGEIEEEHRDACVRIKLLRNPLATNTKSALRGPWAHSHFADMPDSPEYLQTLYKFSEGIKASGVNGQICPHPDRVMVRYYGPDDAKQAEKFLKDAGFDFMAESDG